MSVLENITMAPRRVLGCSRKDAEDRARRFTYREAARLQGFAKDFTFPETENASLDMKYKVAGNAVPPPLFEAVARALPPIWD